MFGIGMPEMILLLAIALIVIGPKKLPALAKSLGRAMNEFKRATSDIKDSFEIGDEFGDVKKSLNEIKDDVKTSVMSAGTPESVKPGDAAGESAPDRDTSVADKKGAVSNE